jgi:hypothetical protein
MSLAWMAYEAKKYEFENNLWTPDDLWRRQEERNGLFAVFDQAVEVFPLSSCTALTLNLLGHHIAMLF